MRLADFAPRLARARDAHESLAWRLGYCASGCHDDEPNGRCSMCGELCGSTLDTEPYDFSSARRELASIHEYIRRNGLVQAYGDGQWGYTSGYYEPEWAEVGNTVQALEWIARTEAEGSYWEGVVEFKPGFTEIPSGVGTGPSDDEGEGGDA